jgi:hypothetical protein
VIDRERPGARALQLGEEAQQGRFPATARAEHADELARADRQVHPVERDDRSPGGIAVFPAHPGDDDLRGRSRVALDCRCRLRPIALCLTDDRDSALGEPVSIRLLRSSAEV